MEPPRSSQWPRHQKTFHRHRRIVELAMLADLSQSSPQDSVLAGDVLFNEDFQR